MAKITKHEFSPTAAARVAVEKLSRDAVLAHCVWLNPGGSDASLGINDEINITLPALLASRTRSLRETTDITFDFISEVKTSVKLMYHLYQAVLIDDATLTLNIQDFANQVIGPVVRGISNGIENIIATVINTTTYDMTITGTKATVLDGIVQGLISLDRAFVPKENRVIVSGTGVQATLLRHPDLVRYDGSGDNTALRSALIGTLYGMPVFTSPLINSKFAYIYHKSAFPVVLRTPVTRPVDGPEWGKGVSVSASGGNFTIRLSHDRDTRKLADIMVADVFAGVGHMKDRGKLEITNGLPKFTPWTTDKDKDTEGPEKFVRAVSLQITDALG